MRFNGIGTTWLGASKRDPQNCVSATLWFTFLFVPLVPLRRCRLELLPHKGSGFAYRELEATPLSARELVETWLFSLVLVPLMAFTPMLLGLEELRRALRYPEWLQSVFIGVGIVWFIVFIWKLSDWHEERYHPKA